MINLDRTPERLAAFAAQNPGLDFERFAAVDGATRPRAAWIADGLITPDNIYSSGAIGCAASHVALWRDCVAREQACHVVEDDVILRRDFRAMTEALLQRTDGTLSTGPWNFNWPLEFWPADGLAPALLQLDPQLISEQYDAFAAAATPSQLVRIGGGAGTGCYAIAPWGAAKLLKLCLPIGAQPAKITVGNLRLDWDNTGIDVEAARHFRDLRAFAALPPLAAARNELATSTIRGPT